MSGPNITLSVNTNKSLQLAGVEVSPESSAIDPDTQPSALRSPNSKLTARFATYNFAHKINNAKNAMQGLSPDEDEGIGKDFDEVSSALTGGEVSPDSPAIGRGTQPSAENSPNSKKVSEKDEEQAKKIESLLEKTEKPQHILSKNLVASKFSIANQDLSLEEDEGFYENFDEGSSASTGGEVSPDSPPIGGRGTQPSAESSPNSKKVSDEDEELAKQIEALLEELAKHPGGAGDLQKETQDIKDQIKKSLEDAGASDEDINDIMDQIGGLADLQGDDRAAAIENILNQVSQLTGKTPTELADQLKATLNNDINNNIRMGQALDSAAAIQNALKALAEHPGGAQARLDSIRKFLNDHNVPEDDIDDIMNQIQSLSGDIDKDTIAKLLIQISDLTGVSVQDLTGKIQNRINFDISNNIRAEVNYKELGEITQDAVKSQNPGAKRNLDNVQNMYKEVRGFFPTQEDLEKLGFLDLDRLNRNFFNNANAFNGILEAQYLKNPSQLGIGNMMSTLDSALLELNQQIAGYVQATIPLLSAVSPSAAQAANDLLKTFQAGTTGDPQALGNPQVPSSSTYRQFMLRMESALTTEKQTDVEIEVNTQISKDQQAANADNIKNQLDAVNKGEKEKHMSKIKKLFHKIASFFVDLGQMVAGALKIVVGGVTHNSKMQASGAAQLASGAMGLVKDIANLVLDLIGDNDPNTRSKLDNAINKATSAIQDALNIIVGALDIAMGEEAQGAALVAAGAVSLVADVLEDILDATIKDPEKRKQMEEGLNMVRGIANFIATAVSLTSAYRAIKKGFAEIGKKGAQAAEKGAQAAGKAVDKSVSKLDRVTKGFDLGRNLMNNTLNVTVGITDTITGAYQIDASKAIKKAEESQAELEFLTEAEADTAKFNEKFATLDSFFQGFINELAKTSQMIK